MVGRNLPLPLAQVGVIMAPAGNMVYNSHYNTCQKVDLRLDPKSFYEKLEYRKSCSEFLTEHVPALAFLEIPTFLFSGFHGTIVTY